MAEPVKDESIKEVSPKGVTSDLDNPAWSALTTFQAHLAVGGSLAKRYPPDIAPIAGIGTRDPSSIDELCVLVPEGDVLSLPGTLEELRPLMPPRVKIILQKRLVQMVSAHPPDVPSSSVAFSVLSDADVPDMLELVALTHPGPFRPRTYTLGAYLGIRIDGRLAAMAGQRMHLPGWREVSAVCTHPAFQGRGYARALIARLDAMIRDEGLTPFLHVEESNVRAQEVYAALGFVERKRLPLLVIERAT
jgi:ribosomal protein S18 acetylase RimI-like enzyme